MRIDVVADFNCVCGECPVWHPLERRLYWLDNETGRIFRYDPAGDRAEQVYEGRTVAGLTVQPDGALLLFRDRGNVVRWRDGEELGTLIDEVADDRDTRFNDVMADPEGRVFAGTMPTQDKPGRLYRLDRDASLHLALDDVGIANGMGFTPDGRTMFFTDTTARTIWRFAYDRPTGALTHQRPFVEVTDGKGLPDGMVVDAAGDVWSAHWDGSGVYRYRPDGRLREKIELPATKITSLIFAPGADGDELTDVYVTSAGADDRPANGEHAGALFRLRGVGIAGQPEHFSRIGE